MNGEDFGFRRVVETLDRLKIPFYVCGSLASSIHGVYRATADIDLVADVRPFHIPKLVAELGKEFYADADMIRDALQAGRSFNLIHYTSSYKFDIFPASDDPYQQAQFERRKLEQVAVGGARTMVPVSSAEDTVLNKLAWYRAGRETSERQWNDVRGIVDSKRDRLDRDYLRRWAPHLKVEDLLERVLAQ